MKVALTLFGLVFAAPQLEAQSMVQRADSVFGRYATGGVPGCAVGVDSAGQSLLRRGYGQAELEFGSDISPATIFEAGSVSKQFTAAAVLLLEARGTLSLDDAVQKWFPELPSYPAPVTIRHLMQHTSGLRDWGVMAAIAGWPRTRRAHDQSDALSIIARQRHLNHNPGERFSYTNSGYNLMAMLVERAARMPFEEFTRREFFEPLGMRSTSWRSDFTRLVPGRAQAYERQAGSWHLDMPFENVHGNGGLLTTVGDLLIWTRALEDGRIGRPDVSGAMKTMGKLNDGKDAGYGGGLFLTPVGGVPAISHGGSTAGYRAILSHFPEQDIAVAILCNRADASTGQLARRLLEGRIPFEPMTPPAPSPAAANAPAYRLDATLLPQYGGRWQSDEVGATLQTHAVDGALILSRRPGLADPLRPVAVDSFAGPSSSTVIFERDSAGVAVRMIISMSRADSVVFSRAEQPSDL